MSRFISCLSHGLLVGATRQAAASRPMAAITLHMPASHVISNSSNGPKSIYVSSRRNLYTENALGISKLDRLRSKKEQMFLSGGAKERYIERLSNYVQTGDIQSIYKDDLINLIGIASDDKDLDLLETIVSKADEQQSGFFKGWGTSVMRLYYKQNQLDRALKNAKDIDKFRSFFNLRSCYKVLMCMLYDAQRFDDVLDVYDFAQQHLKNEEEVQSSDRDLSLIALAAMAKLNNEKSLTQAEALYNKLRKISTRIGLRPTSFVTYLAISNNQPKLALNLISNVPNRTYITLRELKIISLLQMERYEDILLQLREYVASIKRESNLLLQSTYDKIKENKDKIQDPSMRQELEDLLSEIKEGGHVSTTTIEELLFKPIDQERSQQFDPRSAGNNYRQPGGYNNDRYSSSIGYNNDRYQGGGYNSNNNYQNNRYPSRGPRNQYGNNQYNSGDRPPRRNNYEFDDAAPDAEEGDERRAGRTGRQARFSYQNMNLD